jgi:hypothetical protein
VPESDDYDEPGQRNPHPGSPLLSLVVIALVFLTASLPCWILAAALLLGLPLG